MFLWIHWVNESWRTDGSCVLVVHSSLFFCDPAVGQERRGGTSLRQHLCGSLVWSQQEDPTWRRTQQRLQRGFLPADRSTFPQLEGVIPARLTEPLAEVSKYTSCALVLLLVVLRGQCCFIQAGRRWAVVISTLVLSLTITDTSCH